MRSLLDGGPGRGTPRAPAQAGRAGDQASLLGGVTVLQGQGAAGEGKAAEFMAVPYYAWANRGPGPMLVWIRESKSGK
jgi:DUF1680 family protein